MEKEKIELVAKEGSVYTTEGKYMFSIATTDRAKELLQNDGWQKGKESWLDYRARTKEEREIEEKKKHQLAIDIAEAYNAIHNKH